MRLAKQLFSRVCPDSDFLPEPLQSASGHQKDPDEWDGMDNDMELVEASAAAASGGAAATASGGAGNAGM